MRCPLVSEITVDSAVNKHTVSFSRKVNDGKYGASEATVFIQIDTPSLTSADDLETYLNDVIAKVNATFIAAKGAVLDQLGIEYDLDEDGILTETPAAPAVNAPDAVTTVRAAFGGGEVQHDNVVQGNFGADVDPTKLPKSEQKEWLKNRLASHPGEFMDNRQAKRDGYFVTRDGRKFDVKPNSPDFKHKSSGLGYWA